MRWPVLAVAFALTLTLASADDKEDLAKLTKDLKSKDAKVRLKAVEQLAELGEAAAKPLCDAMMDSSAKVAQAALTSLEKAHPKLYKPVSTMVLDRDRNNELDAVNTIGLMGEKGRPVLGLLIARGTTELTSGLRGGAVAYLKAIEQVGGEEDDTVRYFKTAATSRHQIARGDALEWLAKWAGDKEVRRKELLPVVKAGIADTEVGSRYIELAGKLGPVAKELLPTLKQLKTSKLMIVREAATKAVEQIESP